VVEKLIERVKDISLLGKWNNLRAIVTGIGYWFSFKYRLILSRLYD